MKFLSSTLLIAVSLVASTDCFTPRGPGFVSPNNNNGGKANGAVDISLESSTLETTRNSWSPVFPTPAAPMPKETTVAAVPKMAQRWRKSTKQLTTLGPASSNKEMIEKLFLAGADVFRLNFSHGSQEQKKELLMIIREIEEKYAHPIGILGDLQGPKLRVSR
jgi:hypothetical protein